MNRVFSIFLGIIFFTNNASAIEKIPQDIANSYRLIGVEKTLIGVAESMMASQGKMIDNITQFVSSSASDKILLFTYKIFKNKNELDIPKVKSKIYNQSISAICSNPLYNFILVEMGAIFTINYYDLNNLFLFQIKFQKNDCRDY